MLDAVRLMPALGMGFRAMRQQRYSAFESGQLLLGVCLFCILIRGERGNGRLERFREARAV